MSTSASPFVWYELMTTDADAAAKFYGSVVGWKIPVDSSITERSLCPVTGLTMVVPHAVSSSDASRRLGSLRFMAILVFGDVGF